MVSIRCGVKYYTRVLVLYRVSVLFVIDLINQIVKTNISAGSFKPVFESVTRNLAKYFYGQRIKWGICQSVVIL